MLSDKAQIALFDIRDNIRVAKQFTEGLSYEVFQASKLHLSAATRAVEIVSEAARRLSQDFRDRHPDLPWKRIMGIGNVLRHNYENVVESIIWETARTHLDPLLAAVAAEIDRSERKT